MAAAAGGELVSLNYGELLDLSLGDARNYGVVSFSLLKDLLQRLIADVGLTGSFALAYPVGQPPEEILRTLTRRAMAAGAAAASASATAAATTGPSEGGPLDGASVFNPETVALITDVEAAALPATLPGLVLSPGDASVAATDCSARQTTDASQAVGAASAAPGMSGARGALSGAGLPLLATLSAGMGQVSSRHLDAAAADRPQSATDVWQRMRADKRMEGIEAGVSGIASIVEATTRRIEGIDRRLADVVASQCQAQLPVQTDIATLVQKMTQLQEEQAALKRALVSLENRKRINLYGYAKEDMDAGPASESAADAVSSAPARKSAGSASRIFPTANDEQRLAETFDDSTVQPVHSDAESDLRPLTDAQDVTLREREASAAAACGARWPSAGSAQALGTETIVTEEERRLVQAAPEELRRVVAKLERAATAAAGSAAAAASETEAESSGGSGCGCAHSELVERVQSFDKTLKGHGEWLAALRAQAQQISAERAELLAALARLDSRRSQDDDKFVLRKQFDERLCKSEGAHATTEAQIKQLTDSSAQWRSRLKDLEPELERKASRQDVSQLRDQLAALRGDVDELAAVFSRELEQDSAAAFRKRMLPFKCLSCSRKMALDKDNAPGPSLPSEAALRSTKSPKPYTSYELDSLRRLAKLTTRPSEQPVGALYHIPRPCGGGAYTMVDPLRAERRAAPASSEQFAAQFGQVHGPFPVVNIINQNIISATPGGVGGGTSSSTASASATPPLAMTASTAATRLPRIAR